MLCSQLNVWLLQSSLQKKIVEWYYRYILILWGSGSMPLLLPLPSPKLKSSNIIPCLNASLAEFIILNQLLSFICEDSNTNTY